MASVVLCHVSHLHPQAGSGVWDNECWADSMGHMFKGQELGVVETIRGLHILA